MRVATWVLSQRHPGLLLAGCRLRAHRHRARDQVMKARDAALFFGAFAVWILLVAITR